MFFKILKGKYLLYRNSKDIDDKLIIKLGGKMDYSQSIKFKKDVFTKQEIEDYYENFHGIIKTLAIEPIQLFLNISIANDENFNFAKIDEFKNQIKNNDEITNVLLSVFCGIKETNSVSLMTVLKETIIVFTSKNKYWVDEEVFKYKEKFKIRKNQIIENTNKTKKTNHRTSLQKTEIITSIAILITIVIAIVVWIIVKR